MIQSLYKPFQHWSEGGALFVFSDTHFDDPLVEIIDKNWIKPSQQIEIINSMVKPCDTFLCLGDIGEPKYIEKIRAKRKILLLGNHDHRSKMIGVFDEIYSGPLFIANKILISHEPVYGLSWCLNIHGHDHSGKDPGRDDTHCLNMAANVVNYIPMNLGKEIQNGLLSEIDDLHRTTIDIAKHVKKPEIYCMDAISLRNIKNEKESLYYEEKA